jgi:CBS domain
MGGSLTNGTTDSAHGARDQMPGRQYVTHSDEIDRRLEGIAGRVGQGYAERLTPRELLEMFGAQRRGASIVDNIRSRLAKHGLGTDPDFEAAGPDDSLDVRQDGDTPLHLRKLREADEALSNSNPPVEVSVRQLLNWFGAERRGPIVVERVQASLAGFDLETHPDFTAAHIDATIELVRRRTHSADNSSPETPDAEAQEPEAPQPSSTPDPTPRIGTLIDPRAKPLVSTRPGESLRAALTKMMAEQISYMPVLAGEHRVLGMLRWRDIATRLALCGGSLDDPVELVAQPKVNVAPTTASFFDLIPSIVAEGYVLVRDERNVVSGIITRSRLGSVLQDQAGPFIMLGEIEGQARRIAERGGFTLDELCELQGEHDPRAIRSIGDLTLGQIARLFEKPENWTRLGLQIDHAEFMSRFHAVREIRNDLMHFNPDSPSLEQKQQLANFQAFMREVERAMP